MTAKSHHQSQFSVDGRDVPRIGRLDKTEYRGQLPVSQLPSINVADALRLYKSWHERAQASLGTLR